MKSNRNFVNVLPLLAYTLVLLLFILLPILALADGAGEIAPTEHFTPKQLRSAETVRPHERLGALLPFPTYHEWDEKDRPKYWNGYGVDPSGVNYWTYWNESTECLPGYSDVWEGAGHCKQEEEETLPGVAVPEPNPTGLFATGIIVAFVWLMLRRKK